MSKRTTVLIIDDEPDFISLVEYNLKLAGYKVYSATDGPKGLKLAEKHIPEVILLDRSMPEMDGPEVLSELKHRKKTARIPVFMLTAKTTLVDIDHAFEIGADDYITKPVELTKLGQIIRIKLDKVVPKIEQ